MLLGFIDELKSTTEATNWVTPPQSPLQTESEEACDDTPFIVSECQTLLSLPADWSTVSGTVFPG